MKRKWTPARVLAFAAAFCVLAIVVLHAYFAAMIWWWRDHPPRETAFMSERMQVLHDKNPGARLRYRFVPYDRIATSLKRAMIAAEDAKFVEHEGFDWDGITVALEKNEKRGRIVAGGSTITQQLAKNLFLSGSRSWVRKGEEAIITVLLEAMLDKRRIFELYLNVVEWGSGVFGAEAAALHYFDVSASRLSSQQAARLAAMAPNPRFYEHHQGAPGLNRKIGIILARMPAADFP
ncbi:MAG TPA: monofunctional biosynthetic peptidoglycan transglycosylase [Casimicrobiaceae bacterium]|nr:monofunctional biosynthetic peptidoglycan transglycosylase [Casimicrobiaceae bacterium]